MQEKNVKEKLREKLREMLGRTNPSTSEVESKAAYTGMKIVDTLKPQKKPSRQVKWWKLKGFVPIFKEFRKGEMSERVLGNIKDIRTMDVYFGLKGYQFGGWVDSNEDRFNYLSALAICFYDLNKVMQFYGNNMGFGVLGIAFGARGHSRAHAHYETLDNVINLTRYKRANAKEYQDKNIWPEPPTKEYRFVNSGGPGALAHEYGHFLDFVFGTGVEPYNGKTSLSGGKDSFEDGKVVYSNKFPIRKCMEELLTLICTDSKGGESSYVKRLNRFPSSDKYKKYLLERVEIFARVFEAYIAYELQEKNIQNSFLNSKKYVSTLYPTKKELEVIAPKMKELIRHFRRYVNNTDNLEVEKK